MDNKIDFVMIWVDGGDEAWRKEKNKYAGLPDDTINGEIRFRDWDNLKYWFRGVEKFAPWVNNVYFVTCGHYPKWLNLDCPKLKFIKHSDYIPEKYLPTFSSHTIELNLHRIEGLSEKFVYFNDDTFLTKKVTPEDFFKNDLPLRKVDEVILPGEDDFMSYVQMTNSIVIKSHFDKHEVIKKNFSKFFSLKNGLKPTIRKICLLPFKNFSTINAPHLSSSMLKSTFEEVWNLEDALLDQVSSDKFRQQISVNQYLFKMWDICTGKYMPTNYKDCMYFGIKKENCKEIIDAIRSQKYSQICINDVTSEIEFEEMKKKINDAFESILPEKSSFEI